MNRWFRRTARPVGGSAVGVLGGGRLPAIGPSPRGTLTQHHDRALSTADTVVLGPPITDRCPVPADAPLPVLRTGQPDQRLDAWLPRLDRWPALRRRDGRPEAAPPPWPTLGLPAEAARPGPAPLPGPGGAMLPGGTIGGVGYGGGLPGDDGPFFGPHSPLAEMPWRAAGGEAHPMTAVAARSPGSAGLVRPFVPVAPHPVAPQPVAPFSAGSPLVASEPPTIPAGSPLQDVSGSRPLIFEQLLRDNAAAGRSGPLELANDSTANLAAATFPEPSLHNAPQAAVQPAAPGPAAGRGDEWSGPDWDSSSTRVLPAIGQQQRRTGRQLPVGPPGPVNPTGPRAA